MFDGYYFGIPGAYLMIPILMGILFVAFLVLGKVMKAAGEDASDIIADGIRKAQGRKHSDPK